MTRTDPKAQLLEALANPDQQLLAVDIEHTTTPNFRGMYVQHVPNGTTVWTVTTYNAKADRRDDDQ